MGSRGLLPVACAIAGLGLAGGCGNVSEEDTSTDAELEVVAAAEKTSARGTGTIAMRYSGLVEGESVQDVDFRSDRAAGTMDFYGGAVGPLAGESGFIYVDGVDTYFRFPDLEVTGWIEAPQDATGSVQNQPSAIFSTLDSALEDVERVEGEPGDATYEGTYDVRRLVEETGGGEAPSKLDDLPDAAVEAGLEIVVARDRIESMTFTFGDLDAEALVVALEVENLGNEIDIGEPPERFITQEQLSGSAPS